MEFNNDELGTIQAALASYTRVLEDIERAKLSGFLPPCFNPSPSAMGEAEILLYKISRRNMS